MRHVTFPIFLALALFLKPGNRKFNTPFLQFGGGKSRLSITPTGASSFATQSTPALPSPVAVASEPSTFGLLGTGLLGVGGIARRCLST